MQIHCRCGQEYTVHDRFPHKISCHQCGRHFGVLDDGRTLELDDIEPPESNSKSADPSAVQAAPTLSFKDSTPAFCTLATQEKLVDPTKPLEALEKLQADLRLLDLQWESESDEYLLLPFLGFSLLPSKTLSVVTALGLAFIWATVISAAIEIGANKWVCPLLVGVGFSVLLPMYVFARAHAHEKAEAEWLRKRVWLTAKANQAVTNK